MKKTAKMNSYLNQNRGFTLVELIVSLGLFAVVSTISIGSLITLIDNNRQLRNDQVVIANIGFAFDMMSRDIRQGVDYVCRTFPMSPNSQDPANRFLNQDSFDMVGYENPSCITGSTSESNVYAHGVSFRPPENVLNLDDNRRVAYYFDRASNNIYRRFSNNEEQSIISDSLTILNADFIVTDAEPFDVGPGAANRQPTVTIYVEVQAQDGQIYQLQTTVTQRLLDI